MGKHEKNNLSKLGSNLQLNLDKNDNDRECLRHMSLAASTPILTQENQKKHGDLQVGDSVYTPKGLSRVTATKHYTDSKCMKVVFRGNQEIVSSSGHLWRAMKWNSARVKGEKRVGWESKISKTSELMSSYRNPYIPVTGYSSLPVDSLLHLIHLELGQVMGITAVDVYAVLMMRYLNQSEKMVTNYLIAIALLGHRFRQEQSTIWSRT